MTVSNDWLPRGVHALDEGRLSLVVAFLVGVAPPT